MEKKTIIKYVRSSPKKLRMITDVVIGKKAVDVLPILKLDIKKSSRLLFGAIKGALHQFDKQMHTDVTVKNIAINKGPSFKRWRPGSKGMAHRYEKRTAHIEVTLQLPDRTK